MTEQWDLDEGKSLGEQVVDVFDRLATIALAAHRRRLLRVLLASMRPTFTYPQQPLVAIELRSMRVVGDGFAALPAPSRLAWDALDRAAERLGFRSIAQASQSNALADVISEAIEEVESRVVCTFAHA